MKKIPLLASLLLILTAAAQKAYAATSVPLGPCISQEGKDRFAKLCSQSKAENAGAILSNVFVGAIVVASVIALAFLIYGGFKWISSGGDKAKIEAARNMLIAAIVGLILTLLSYFILTTVLGLFDINITNLTLPTLQ